MNKLKRVVIKEELVALTGDYKKALMLNQFIYWSERVKDFDKFISEEKERLIRHGNGEIAKELILNNGWIYKKSEELAEELMIDYKIKAMREHIKVLVEEGWLSERTNPKFNWDKTKQYRVNLIKIQQDLMKLGYTLDGYSINVNFINSAATPLHQSVVSNEYKKEVRTFQKGNGIDEKESAIPEITTEITKKITTTKQKGFDYLIETFTENKQLKETIIEFIKMRKAIKSTMTDNALKLLLNKLRRMANDDETIIGILEQSIMNSWKGVFELKEVRQAVVSPRTKAPARRDDF